MKQHNEELSLKEKILNAISHFIIKYRMVFISIFVAFAVVLITVLIVNELRKSRTEKSLLQIEAVLEDYERWLATDDEEEKQSLQEGIIERVDRIADSYSRYYAAQRGLFIKANLFYEQEKWQEASEVYKKLYTTYPDSHLSRVSMFNAAAAQEELGNTETAIDIHIEYIDRYSDEVPELPHSKFSLGRLYESLEDFEEAARYYNDLIDNHGSSSWTKLARNRIIFFKTAGILGQE